MTKKPDKTPMPPAVEESLKNWAMAKEMCQVVARYEGEPGELSVARRIAQLGVLRANLIERLVEIDEELAELQGKLGQS